MAFYPPVSCCYAMKTSNIGLFEGGCFWTFEVTNIQVIQIETSLFSCPIRSEQPTKFPGPSGCVSCRHFGSLIFSVCRSIDCRTPVLFKSWYDAWLWSLTVSAVAMQCLFKAVLWFSGSAQALPMNTYGSLIKYFTPYWTYTQLKTKQSMYSRNCSIQWLRLVFFFHW